MKRPTRATLHRKLYPWCLCCNSFPKDWKRRHNRWARRKARKEMGET